MTHEYRIMNLMVRAKYADVCAQRGTDNQTTATWVRIADSCRHIAMYYRSLDREEDIRIFKL